MKIWGAVSCCNLILWTFHQADEGLLQTGGNLPPVIGRMPERRDGPLQGRCIGAADMQRIAEGDGLNTWLAAELFSQTDQVGPAYRPRREANVSYDFVDGTVGEQSTLRNIGQPMTALGLVHVMCGDEKGEPSSGQAMNLFPEIAPCFRIESRGRFVEQEQFRLMNETRGQRGALLPPAGQLAGQLVSAIRQTELREAFFDYRAPVLELVHTRDEIEIFFNG